MTSAAAGTTAEPEDTNHDAPADSPIRRRIGLSGWLAELTAATLALLGVTALTWYRCLAVRDARYPGHADPAFFFNVAQNLHAGRGATIDYIWHFLVPGTPLHHYAFDYWLPLPALLMSLGAGDGVSGALLAPIAMSVLLAVATYFLARSLSPSAWAPALAAGLVACQPVVSTFAVQAESAMFLGAFAVAAMAAASYARTIPALWVLAGSFAGLGNMSRSEGLIVAVVIGLASLAWSERSSWRRRLALYLAGYCVTMAPFVVVNLQHFGAVLPPAGTAFPFVSSYQDLYALHVDRSFSALIGNHVSTFFTLRARALSSQLSVAGKAMAPVVATAAAVLLLPGLLGSRLSLRPGGSTVRWWIRRLSASRWFVPVGCLAAFYLFDALVAPVVSSEGATNKIMVTVVPVLMVVAAIGLSRLRLAVLLTVPLCAILLGYSVSTVAQRTRTTIGLDNVVGQHAAHLGQRLAGERACLTRPMILMIQDPWEFTQATGIPSVKIPTGAVADVLRAAREYGVTDLLLGPGQRQDLRTDLTQRTGAGSAFSEVLRIGDSTLYRLTAAAPQATC